MYLSDMIEAAKVFKKMLGASEVHVSINTQGRFYVSAWDFIDKNGRKAIHDSVGEYFTARTLENLHEQVERYCIERDEKTAKAADFGIREDGSFIEEKPALLVPIPTHAAE